MATPAALHLPPFHSLNKLNRYGVLRDYSKMMENACLHMHSHLMKKCIGSLSSCSLGRQCNIQIYMIPCRSISCLGQRPLSKVYSSKVDVASQVGHVSYDSLASNNLQRFTVSDEMDDFKKQLEELFDEVKTLIVRGKRSEAVELLQANYEAVKEQLDAGYKGVEEAAILDIIALGYTAIGVLDIAGSVLDMLSGVVDNLTDDEPLLGPILEHMGSMYSTLGRSEKSLVMHRRVIGILENSYGKDSVLLVTSLLGMAKVLGSIGRTKKAMEFYNRSINLLESKRGAESEELVVPLLSVGNLLIKEGRAADAEISFMRILTIYRKLYGERDGRVGVAMCSLANVKCAQGNAEEAIQLYQDALQIIKASNYMALDNNAMEKIRIDLAELLHVVGRGNEGREVLEECLIITEKYKGKDHPSSVTHLVNLATSFSRSKNFVEAERLLRMSLQIMMKNVEPDDQSITFPMLQLAVTLYHLNQNKEAEKLALKVLRIREKAFGEESLPVGEALDCLVSIQIRLAKEDGEILDLLKRVMTIEEKEFGNESEEVMVTLKKVVFYLNKMGDKVEKLPLERKLSMLRSKYKHK